MKIALVGAAPSSRMQAPFKDASYEIWVCSPGNYDMPRIDAWFELHSLDRKWVPGNEPYINVISKHPRVYIAVPDQRLPYGIVYPKDEMVATYGPWFFSSSVAWMFALALKQRPTDIGLWGIDMAATDEYEYQRPGLHFFIREAEKLGINVSAPVESDILEPHPLYGYKEQWPMYWKQRARAKEIQDRISSCKKKEDLARTERMMLEGSMQDLNYTNNTWLKP